VRDMHDELEGTEHAWDDPPVTDKYGNRNHPGEDYQCRCVAVPILDEYDSPGIGPTITETGLDGLTRTDYSDDQERDESGRWTAGGGAGGSGSSLHAHGVTVKDHDRVQKAARAIFGHEITPAHVKDLLQVHAMGLPEGSTVEYSARPYGVEGIHYEATARDVHGKEIVTVKRQIESTYDDKTGAKIVEVHHDLMQIHPDLQGKGLGTRLFDQQLQQYQAAGVNRITTAAAWQGGQYTWPSLGFGLVNTGQLSGLKDEASKFLAERGIKADLSKVKSVHDLARMRVKHEGTEHKVGKAFLQWRGNQEHVQPLDLKFDLGAKSAELKAYVKTGKPR
jgi:GNAT superfamily N-acetyltransferase